MSRLDYWVRLFLLFCMTLPLFLHPSIHIFGMERTYLIVVVDLGFGTLLGLIIGFLYDLVKRVLG